jgi:hypothetical protein
MPKNAVVEAWLALYDNPMKAVVERIRAIILGADRRIGECIKWQAPTFVYRGNLASFFPKSKQHASLMFHSGAKIPGKHPLLQGEGGTGRVMKIASVAEADRCKRAIERIVRAWCDWRDDGAHGATSSQPRTKKPGAGARNRSTKASPKKARSCLRVPGAR